MVDATDYRRYPGAVGDRRSVEIAWDGANPSGGGQWGRRALWVNGADAYPGFGVTGIVITSALAADDLRRAVDYTQSGDGGGGFNLFGGAAGDATAGSGEGDGSTGDDEDADESTSSSVSTEATLLLGGGWGHSRLTEVARTEVAVSAAALVLAQASVDAAVTLLAQGRHVAADHFTAWGVQVARLPTAALVESQFFLGPRFESGPVESALAVGADVLVGVPRDGSSALLLTTFPAANLAAEARVWGPLCARGSVMTGFAASSTETELSFAPIASGALGLGVQTDHLAVDLTFSPAWLGAGPHILTGAEQPWSGQASAEWSF